MSNEVQNDIRNMTDSELLSVILQTNAECLLKEYKDLTRISQNILFCDRKGIRGGKLKILEAAFELGRRVQREELEDKYNAKYIRDCRAIFAIMSPQLSALSHEELWAIYTSRNGKIIEKSLIGVGGSYAAIADIKKIVSPAIRNMASYAFLVHNHPHSSTKPSRADKDLTEAAKEALKLFDVKLLDHVIISDGKFYSFSEEGHI